MARFLTNVSPDQNNIRAQPLQSHMSELTLLSNNIGHTAAASDTLRAVADETSAALVMLQEPLLNRRNQRIQGWGSNPCQTPASLSTSSRVCTVTVSGHIGNVHVISAMPDKIAVNRITWQGIHILLINVYLSPRVSIEAELQALAALISESREQNIILAGDWNSRSELWGDRTTDERAELVTAFALNHGLEIYPNASPLPTFVHVNEGSSHVDFVMGRLAQEMAITVRTLDELTHDHRPLLIKLQMQGRSQDQPLTRYNTSKADWVRFRTMLTDACNDDMITQQDVDVKWDMILTAITHAADGAIPKKRQRLRKVPYWTDELTDLRRQRNRARAALMRAQAQNTSVAAFRSAFLCANKQYKAALKREKTRSFAEFIERESETDPWSLAYKVCRDKLPGIKHLIESRASRSVEETMEGILEQFFPAKPAEDIDVAQSRRTADDPPLTVHEIRNAILSMSPDKAPGYDMITGTILRATYEAIPDVMHSLYMMCFDQRRFPIKWKEAVLAVVPKPGKDDYSNLSSYRPISLLSVPGKVLDRIVITRVNHYLHSIPGLMSRSQFGFKPQHSTEGAITNALDFCEEKGKTHYVMMVALDIKSAFDTASHELILNSMRRKGVPGNLIDLVTSFFTDRQVHLIHESLIKSRAIEQGCPQGSVSGPSLWNILMDSLPYICPDSDSNIVCFADDALLQTRARTIDEVITKAEHMIGKALSWCDRHQLTLNMSKTEAMLIPRQIRSNAREKVLANQVRNLTVVHDDQVHEIKCVTRFRYLGVILDQNLNFSEHISHITCKATRVVGQLSRGANKRWGFSAQTMKILYQRCIEPIVCYACPVWGHRASATIVNKRKLDAVQRLMLIRATRSYRTASHMALCSILGVMPIRLRIQELISRGHSLTVDAEPEMPVAFTRFLHPSVDHFFQFSLFGPESNPLGTQIFTDGSKTDGRVGAAYVAYTDHEEKTCRLIKLDGNCSVYQAELMAILRALDDVLIERFVEPISIISDSLSSLKAIRGTDQEHPLVFQIKSKMLSLRDSGHTVSLHYTQAHVGTEGNERADRLAKLASELVDEAEYSVISKQTVKHMNRMHLQRVWQSNWDTSDVGRHTYQFIPQVMHSVPPTAIDHHTIQFLTDHGSFIDYLKRFKAIADGHCLCGASGSNSNHLLLYCSTFAHHPLRAHMNGSIGNLTAVLRDPDKCLIFIDFCNEYVRRFAEQRDTLIIPINVAAAAHDAA